LESVAAIVCVSDDTIAIQLTLAITWPLGVHGDVESLMAAAQVNGGVRRLPQQLEPLLDQFQSTR
jgi:hypothetical protein